MVNAVSPSLEVLVVFDVSIWTKNKISVQISQLEIREIKILSKELWRVTVCVFFLKFCLFFRNKLH